MRIYTDITQAEPAANLPKLKKEKVLVTYVAIYYATAEQPL